MNTLQPLLELFLPLQHIRAPQKDLLHDLFVLPYLLLLSFAYGIEGVDLSFESGDGSGIIDQVGFSLDGRVVGEFLPGARDLRLLPGETGRYVPSNMTMGGVYNACPHLVSRMSSRGKKTDHRRISALFQNRRIASDT
jgi:hypothetical protein